MGLSVTERKMLFEFFCDMMEDNISKEQLRDVYAWTGCEYEHAEEFECALGDALDDYGVCWGASKLVLKFKDCSDWVFKIPFQGDYEYLSSDDCSERQYIPFKDVAAGLRLPGRVFDKDEWDYCYVESEITRVVEETHPYLQDMFAKTYYIGDYGMPIYVSERCDNDWYEEFDVVRDSAEYKAESESYFSQSYRASMNRDQQIAFVLSWGLMKANKLFNFIENVRVDDLHEGNLAYGSDGKVRLIDYSGYHDIFSE